MSPGRFCRIHVHYPDFAKLQIQQVPSYVLLNLCKTCVLRTGYKSAVLKTPAYGPNLACRAESSGPRVWELSSKVAVAALIATQQLFSSFWTPGKHVCVGPSQRAHITGSGDAGPCRYAAGSWCAGLAHGHIWHKGRDPTHEPHTRSGIHASSMPFIQPTGSKWVSLL